MLGTYNTRSATTNPTGKNRFDAGINGNTIKQSAQKRNTSNISNQDQEVTNCIQETTYKLQK